MRRFLTGLLTVTLAATWSVPVGAYLKLGVIDGNRALVARWGQMPVRYFIADRDVPGVTASEFSAAVGRAFDTWQNVTSASIAFERVGFTSAPPFNEDAMTTLGFRDIAGMDRVLATTSFLIDVRTANILEADILFNAGVPWSTADSGQVGRFDVESVALHEIGHLFGLGHSALGETELLPTGRRRLIAAETVLFPLAFSIGSVLGRTLQPDDVAGVSDLYPASDFRHRTGSVAGRVLKNGVGVNGAHVVAYNLQTGTLVGNFSLDAEGRFVIAGLEPGPHVLRVEPLDDGDLESFFGDVASIEIGFRAAFASDLVIVPEGGTASADLQVVDK